MFFKRKKKREGVHVGKSIVEVNGKRIEVPAGSSISVVNNQIMVNGQLVEGQTNKNVLEVYVYGDLLSLQSDRSVTVHGDIQGDVTADGSVTCDEIGGDVQANGSVTADNVQGSVASGGSVVCDSVGGGITAEGSVTVG